MKRPRLSKSGKGKETQTMPGVGEKRRGRDIGKTPDADLFIWIGCLDCGKTRWVKFSNGIPDNKRCKSCNLANQHGSNNPCWRGGRTISQQGYVFLHLESSDFYFPMADRRHYVAEHRLVMAKHLGRCLQPWELVHHKGVRYTGRENKSDNLMDNLELSTNGAHSLAHSEGYREGYRKGVNDGKDKRIRTLEGRITLLEAENILLKEQMNDQYATFR